MVVAASLYLVSRGAWVALGLLLLLVLIVWVALFKQTACDVETKNAPDGCGNTAYGRLRACHLRDHKRAKHDALFALFGLRNPTRAWRVRWTRSPAAYGRTSPAPGSTPSRVTNPLYDGAILLATIAGSVATIIALVLQFN